MTKNVVLIIVDSLYFFCHSRKSLFHCHSRVSLSGIHKNLLFHCHSRKSLFHCHSRMSLSGIYKIIYYSSVIPAKQLSGNLSNNKHPFFCRCRHCDCSLSFAKVYVFLPLSSLRAKAKQSIIKDNNRLPRKN